MDEHFDKHPITMTAVRYVAVAFLLLATFPGDYEPIETGLDGSYRYAVNELAHSDHVWGRDGGLDFGPLGYLLVPLDLGNNLTRAVTLWLVVHLVFAFCVLDAARTAPRTSGVVVFSLAYVGAAALGLPYGYHLLVVVGLLMMAALRARWHPEIAAVAGGTLAGLVLLMKLTLGVAAMSIVAAGALALWTPTDPRGRRAALASIAACLGTGLALSALLFESRAAFDAWIATTVELVGGFGSAMSLSAHPSVPVLGGVALLIVFGTAFFLRRRELDVLEAGVVFGTALVLSFREGLVRQDSGITHFFPFAIAVLAVFML
ncbi:MAG: hypothetical protein R3344_09615, partial [Acidobacteriota bacterium]|nr:hypothetical protein [Acidobacteriota bacterium]